MTPEFAGQIAARIWCDEAMDPVDSDAGMASREMDLELCETIACLLYAKYGKHGGGAAAPSPLN